RTERLAEFSSLVEVEATLDGLARREPALVMRHERQPGQKEARYAHLLSGVPAMPEPEAAYSGSASGAVAPRADRMAALEAEVAELRDEVAELRAELEELRALWT